MVGRKKAGGFYDFVPPCKSLWTDGGRQLKELRQAAKARTGLQSPVLGQVKEGEREEGEGKV